MKRPVENPERILVVNLLYIGDLLFTVPFLQGLRENFPTAEIHLVANASSASILEGEPYLDALYSYNKDWDLKRSWQFIRPLRKMDYAIGLNIHGSLRSNLLFLAIFPHYRIGFRGFGRDLLFHKTLKKREDLHMVEAYLSILTSLGWKRSSYLKPRLDISPSARESMERFLEREGVVEDERLIGLNPGGSWPTKQWPKEKFAKLADTLSREGIQVLFLGGPTDVERVNSILASMETRPFVATGKVDLKELAALLSLVDLVVSGDSGPLHVAASVGRESIALFGPSDERKYRPLGDDHQIIIHPISCRPCGEHNCLKNHHRCMEGIEVEKVYEACIEALEKKKE